MPTNEASLAAPIARRDPKTLSLHGHTLTDDFAWMRDKSSPEVIAYLEAENAFTADAMRATEDLQATLYREMLSHIKETDESVPYPYKGWWYSTRTVEGSQYAIHARRQAAPDGSFDPAAPEMVLLDVNLLAKGQPFMSLGGMAISPGGFLLAYSTDNTGFRQYTLHLRDLRTGEDLPDTAQRVGSLVWAADNQTLLYTTEDEQTKRQDKLFRHTLGNPQSADALVYEEADERFNLGAGRTRDGKYLLLEAGSHTASETRFLDATDPAGTFTVIAPRVDEQEYSVDHRDGLFYIRVNDTGKNFRVVTAPVASPGRDAWTELIPEDLAAPLEDLDLFQTFAVASRRRAGLTTLEVLHFTQTAPSSPRERLPSPSPPTPPPATSIASSPPPSSATATSPWSRPPPFTATISPPAPPTLLKEQEVPGGFDRALYASERLWIPAADGTQLPVSLVYRRDSFKKDATNPLYVYGYGSYGYPLPIGFSPSRLSLLDRGLVLAYAHIRGGGDLGDPWHDAGKMMVKRNTFTDFIDITASLRRAGLRRPRPHRHRRWQRRRPAHGRRRQPSPRPLPCRTLPRPLRRRNEHHARRHPSPHRRRVRRVGQSQPAGSLRLHGLLLGPMTTSSPAPTPPCWSRPASTTRRSCTGSPPSTSPGSAASRTNDATLLLHINMDAGHGGASGRYDYLKEIAFDYAFLLRELGVERA